MAFLVNVEGATSAELKMEDIPVVRDYPDVFLEDIRDSTRSTSGVLNRFGTKSSTDIQSTLPDGPIRVRRAEDPNSRTVGQRIYPTKCITLGCTGLVREEEGWDDEDLY